MPINGNVLSAILSKKEWKILPKPTISFGDGINYHVNMKPIFGVSENGVKSTRA